MILPKRGRFLAGIFPFFYWLKPINGRQIFSNHPKCGMFQAQIGH